MESCFGLLKSLASKFRLRANRVDRAAAYAVSAAVTGPRGGRRPLLLTGDKMKNPEVPANRKQYTLIVTLNEKSNECPSGKFKVKVTAYSLQEACRAIVHRQMEKGESARKICEYKKHATND